jgi:ribonuclease T2
MQVNQSSMTRTVLAVLLLVAFAVVGGELGGSGSRSKGTQEPAASPESAAPPAPAVASVDDAVAQDVSAAAPSLASPPVVPSDADFDFYVLTLSWSPTHCSSDAGGGRDDDLQCRSGRPFGFVLHGLWPQHEKGWPEFCDARAPRRLKDSVMREALALSPSEKLLQHEWEKHGTCSGLSQEDYFAAAELAVESLRVPKAYKQPAKPLVTTANAVRRAFLDANPGLSASDILVTCRRNEIGEVRVCLDKELRPRACSREAIRSHCGSREARMLDVRGNWPRN